MGLGRALLDEGEVRQAFLFLVGRNAANSVGTDSLAADPVFSSRQFSSDDLSISTGTF